MYLSTQADLTCHENCQRVSLRISISQQSSLMPLKRPKKTKTSATVKKETTYLKSISYLALANRFHTYKGSVHDFSIYKQTCPDWLPKNTCYLETVVTKAWPSYITHHSFKKSKGGELLALCKQENQYLSKLRILVEHKICLIKLFKNVAQRYSKRYGLRVKLFAGLVNFELKL